MMHIPKKLFKKPLGQCTLVSREGFILCHWSYLSNVRWYRHGEHHKCLITIHSLYIHLPSQTVSIIGSCILGLLERPDILKAAQKELDSVIKQGHLPELDDEASLPYITAITKETLRWRDAVPIGMFKILPISQFSETVIQSCSSVS